MTDCKCSICKEREEVAELKKERDEIRAWNKQHCGEIAMLESRLTEAEARIEELEIDLAKARCVVTACFVDTDGIGDEFCNECIVQIKALKDKEA